MSFDPLVANPGRLEILTALAADARQDFAHLRRQTNLTDGNLASHAKRLQTAGLIEIEKQFRAGKPVTSYILTAAGRTALQDHVGRVMNAMTRIASPETARPHVPVRPAMARTAWDEDENWVD